MPLKPCKKRNGFSLGFLVFAFECPRLKANRSTTLLRGINASARSEHASAPPQLVIGVSKH
jgi:hypothetical protein